MNKRVILKKNKQKSVISKHPWIFPQSINEIDDSISDGDWVDVFDYNHNYLASGYFNSKSLLAVRLFNFIKSNESELEIINELIINAIWLRKEFYDSKRNTVFRLINGEGDFLPGLICDLYDNVLVFQFNSLGLIKKRIEISNLICRCVFDLIGLNITGIIDKTPDKIISAEGTKKINPIIKGEMIENIKIIENNLIFNVNLKDGQKTGFYSDQRENRKIISSYIKNLSGYDFFSYSGGFAINLAKNNNVTAVESSENACKMLKENSKLNNVNINIVNDDVYKVLRQINQCDFINADPPKYIFNSQNKLSGAKQYSLLFSLCLKKIKHGGYFGASSCSGLLNYNDFLGIITNSAVKNNRKLQILFKGGAGRDYPINAHCTESEYLKFALFRVF